MNARLPGAGDGQPRRTLSGENRKTRSRGKHSRKPVPTAFFASLGYSLFIAGYIYLSGELVARIAGSVEDLMRLERIKGMVFVLVSGTALFLLLLFLLRRDHRKEELIVLQNRTMIAAERLIKAGIFSSSVSHDMKNILNVLLASLDVLEESPSLSGPERQAVSDALKVSEDMNRLAERLLQSSGEPVSFERKKADLAEVTRRVISLAEAHTSLRHCTVRFLSGTGIHGSINLPLYERMLINLMLNAGEAMEGYGLIRIRLEAGQGRIVLQVEDQGPGIPPEQMDRVMEPFFTTKQEGNGLGLLSMKMFVEMHSGRMDILTSEWGGACFRIEFPAAEG